MDFITWMNFFKGIVKLIMFIIYKLPCLLCSRAVFIMVITFVPPGTLACVHLDCSIWYSLMSKQICFASAICMYFLLFFFFYIIGRQKIKFLTKSGTSSTVKTNCLFCAVVMVSRWCGVWENWVSINTFCLFFFCFL